MTIPLLKMASLVFPKLKMAILVLPILKKTTFFFTVIEINPIYIYYTFISSKTKKETGVLVLWLVDAFALDY